jgi:3-oxoacyl-[acyl-carrier protein] reductase
VLINNASSSPPAPSTTRSRHGSVPLGVNLVAPAILCRAAVCAFRTQPEGGIIINIGSRAAFRGEDPDSRHYAAPKAGRTAVTAFAIAPGYVDPPFNRVFADTVEVEVATADPGIGEVA